MSKTPIIALIIIVLGATIAGFSLRKQPVSNTTSGGTTATTQSTGVSSTTPSVTGNSSATVTDTASYSKNDVAKHGSADDCWTIISGSVYNLTSFIPSHPGGEQIVQACGIDATSMFDAQHGYSRQAQSELSRLKIGALAS